MAKAAYLTDKAIEKMRGDGRKRIVFDGGDVRGFHITITPDGVKSYGIMARDPNGRQVWRTIARVGEKSLAEARKLASEGRDRITGGLVPTGADLFPKETPPETFGTVVENFLKREVRGKRRSAGEIERHFNVYVLPRWKDRPLSEIRRADVTALLDKIEDTNGPAMADHVLATIRRFFNWQQARDDSFVSPVVRGMNRTSPAGRARDRVLSDDEIRLLWGIEGQFADFCRVALLTGARREKVAGMRWSDIDDKGVWTIPGEDREKANAGTLPLPEMALEIIRRQPMIEKCPWVFRGRTGNALAGFNSFKRDLDAAMTKANEGRAIPAWVIHDLRRTARSLMSRAGVSKDHAERVLGHKQAGVVGVYDRHAYVDEKGAALNALASLVETILHPTPDKKVVDIRSRKAS